MIKLPKHMSLSIENNNHKIYYRNLKDYIATKEMNTINQ